MTDLRDLSRGTRPLSVFSGTGVFVGYAALFNRVDAAGDVIAPGAFADSLARRGSGGIRMLFQHDPAEPVGTWVEIAEDAHGLAVRGRLARDVQRSRELLALLEQRALDGLSIGFKAVTAAREKISGIRRLQKIDLWEISLVTFPMQQGARVISIKAAPEAMFGRGKDLPLPRHVARQRGI